MAADADELDRRLHILSGQVEGLRRHLADASRSCGEVAHLVGIVDGGWRKIRAAVLRGYVHDCLLDVELDERTRALLEAVERIGAR